MKAKRTKLALIVTMSILAGGLCQNVWADETYTAISTITNSGTYNFGGVCMMINL